MMHALAGHKQSCACEGSTDFPPTCRKPAGPASELATVRTLAVLSAVWHQLSLAKKQGLAQPDPPQSQLSHYITILGPLVGTLTTPEARQALSAGFVALSGLLPEMATPARLLTKLSKRSDSTIGEPDYESSLTAYGEMSVELWKGLDRTQGLPLIQQCFWDLRNPNDLALRHAAAQVNALPGGMSCDKLCTDCKSSS